MWLVKAMLWVHFWAFNSQKKHVFQLLLKYCSWTFCMCLWRCGLTNKSLAEQGSEKGKRECNVAMKTSLESWQHYLELENLLCVLCLSEKLLIFIKFQNRASTTVYHDSSTEDLGGRQCTWFLLPGRIGYLYFGTRNTWYGEFKIIPGVSALGLRSKYFWRAIS